MQSKGRVKTSSGVRLRVEVLIIQRNSVTDLIRLPTLVLNQKVILSIIYLGHLVVNACHANKSTTGILIMPS